MNMLKLKIACLIGLMMLASQTSVFADNRTPSHRGAPYTHWQKTPAHHSKGRQRSGNYRNVPAPYYQHYYKPGYRVNPLPYGHSRVFVNAAEYYFFDGFFYRPYGGGYVVVEAPDWRYYRHTAKTASLHPLARPALFPCRQYVLSQTPRGLCRSAESGLWLPTLRAYAPSKFSTQALPGPLHKSKAATDAGNFDLGVNAKRRACESFEQNTHKKT